MKTLNIYMPTTGYVTMVVEVPEDFVATEDNVIDTFWDNVDDRLDDVREDHQWEFTPRVTTGNVPHAMQNSVDWDLDE